MGIEIREPATSRIAEREDGPPVDLTALDGLRALDEDRLGFLGRIIALFLTEARVRIDEIESALAAGDSERVHRSAHTLKSSAATVGAFRLAALCRELQDAAGHASASAQLLEPIVSEFDRVANILEGIAAKGEVPHALR